MDTIVTCRLLLVFLEFQHTAAQLLGKIPVIEHHDKLLSSAQQRFNKAVESLARVMRRHPVTDLPGQPCHAWRAPVESCIGKINPKKPIPLLKRMGFFDSLENLLSSLLPPADSD